MKVLIAEDSNVTRRMLEVALGSWGYDVISTRNGEEAWDTIQYENELQLAVLDWMMPGLDGVEICRRVRETIGNRYLYIILLTNKQERESLIEGFQAGADDFLTKPFDPDELEQRIRSGRRIVQLQQDLREKSVHLTTEITEREKAEHERNQLEHELVESARRVGMADVASGVLHNVGNVLNSVNVVVNCMSDRLRNSRVSGLVKTKEMLAENANNLPEFLTNNVRGQQLTEYLDRLADQLVTERDELSKELDELSKAVEHIKEIVAMQQSFATLSGLMQPVDITAVIVESLKINAGQSQPLGLDIVTSFDEDLPEIVTDRHKILQILINLISNAEYAVTHSNVQEKRIIVKARRANDNIAIDVIDNGMGIRKEDLARVFSSGFTTKKDGHGYGLHASAISANELGGSMTVYSDGVEKGARFTLFLPATCDAPESVALIG